MAPAQFCRSSTRVKKLSTIGIVAVLIAFWAAMTASYYPHGMTNDFASFYTGARLVVAGRLGQMYDLEAQQAIYREICPEELYLSPYLRPPFFAVATMWLAALPLREAFAVWVLIQWGVLLACSVWAARRFGWDALIWAAMSFPVFAGIAHGQDSVLLLGLCVAVYILAERKREEAAGLVFSLALIKFNLWFALPLLMAAGRRWRMLAGFAAGAAGLGAWTAWTLGRAGLSDYYNLLTNSALPKLQPSTDLAMNAEALLAAVGIENPVALATFSVSVVALGLWGARNAPLWKWMSVALITCLLSAPHVYIYNAAILLLPVWLIYFQSQNRWSRILAAVHAAPLLAFLRLAPHGAAATPLVLLALLATLAFDSPPGLAPAAGLPLGGHKESRVPLDI